MVKEGRGKRLTTEQDIFSGLFWLGDESVEMGLVDGLASSSKVAREIIGEEKMVDFTPKEDWLDRFTGSLGAAMANAMFQEGRSSVSIR